MRTFFILLMSLLTLGKGEEKKVSMSFTGPNVCMEQREEIKMVNVTFMTRKSVKEYTWCLKVPPRCPVWRDKLVRGHRPEEVRRVVNEEKCCNGYEQVVYSENVYACRPKCVDQCLHGRCVLPDTCECDAGYSGPRCETLGCSDPFKWGENCSNSCDCVKDQANCDPRDGQCHCLPGFEGEKCAKRCENGRYGRDCGKKCECSIGQKCHHVTGDCINCDQGRYGDMCSKKCECNPEGTSLCYHMDGRCFCKPHYYGPKCELRCKFGYRDNICLNEPDEFETCRCASDLYECDKELGCVCKTDGDDCHLFTAAITANEDFSEDHLGLIKVGLVVLIVALLALALMALYYRRRMRRLQKDLGNRSVRFLENSVKLDLNNGVNNERVGSNAGMGSEEQGAAGGVLNNARVKNVNVDRFKLETSSATNENGDNLKNDFDINLYEEYKANNALIEKLRGNKNNLAEAKVNYDNERNALFEQTGDKNNDGNNDDDLEEEEEEDMDELKRRMRLQYEDSSSNSK